MTVVVYLLMWVALTVGGALAEVQVCVAVVVAIEVVLVPLVGRWAARARMSRCHNALFAAVAGIAAGSAPFLLWFAIAALVYYA